MLRASALLLVSLSLFAQAPRLRLPDTVAPLAYEVDLRLTPGVDDFAGRVRIDVEVRRATSVIWLHAKELEITAARVGDSPAVAEVHDGDFVAITSSSAVAAGRTTLVLEYRGKASRTLTDGIFQQRDRGDWYIFTKFEPVTARRAFPCFDEPSFKTPWQLTLHVPAGLKAVSNTPVESEQSAGDGTRTVRFARSKPLPSYLVAFAVGPFDEVAVPPIGRGRVPGRIYTPHGRGAEAAYAASRTPEAIRRLEEYFGTPYPYEKLDQVVVPLTTAWGAMENAGMIAYGQSLLARPGEDTPTRERGRLSTMVHEMSHQWFGDLVTPPWWDDIWLNEGFASWMTSKILRDWHPEWNVRVSQVGGANNVMGSDALVTARRVRQTIEAPGDIAAAFDSITYSKGAAILNMFESWLGEETFRKGIRAYLDRHIWRTATTRDLLVSLSEAAGWDVDAAFSSFLDQSGAPLLTANVDCSGAIPVLELRQERFLPLGSKGSAAAAWKLPVCVRWSDGRAEHRQCALLDKVNAKIPVDGAASCPAWIFANAGAAGYYRSAYGGPWFERLVDRGIGKLTREERASALYSVQALLGAGKVDAEHAVALAMTFGDSEEREVVAASVRIANIVGQAAPDNMQANHARFLRTWLGKRARQLGWTNRPGDSDDTRAIRSAIVPLLAIGGEDPELGAQATKLAAAWIQDRKSVDREMAPLILVAAARRGGRALFDRLVTEMRKTTDQRERMEMGVALAAFKDPSIMRDALALILNPGEGLDARELTRMITTQWRETRDTVWDFVKQNFEVLNARLPGARGIPYAATLPNVMSGFCSEQDAAAVQGFFEPRLASLSGGPRNLARAVEEIRLCAARRSALQPGAERFLRRY